MLLSASFTPKTKSLKPDFFTGDVTLFIDDEKVGKLADIKMAGQYSAVTGYGLQIGRNTSTPVSHVAFAFDALDPVIARLDRLNLRCTPPKPVPGTGIRQCFLQNALAPRRTRRRPSRKDP